MILRLFRFFRPKSALVLPTLPVLLLLLAGLGPASVFAQDQTKAPEPAQSASRDYPLAPGDDIRVLVFQNPDLTLETRISERGAITYPLIGSVDIGGLAIAAAESKIARALDDGGFVKRPQVNIVLVQARGNQVSVLGQVNSPGRFPLESMHTRVSDVLALAGGITATGDDVVILSGQRNGQPFRQEINIPELYRGGAQSDVALAGGDTIYVDRAPVFYIYGEAQRPGQYRVEHGMTVMQALAQGGGPTPRGSDSRLLLHRKGADGSVQKLSPELGDRVHADDVIYVRESLF